MKLRKQVSLNKDLVSDGEKLAKLRKFDSFSELLEALLREEHERRFGRTVYPAHAPTGSELNDASSTPAKLEKPEWAQSNPSPNGFVPIQLPHPSKPDPEATSAHLRKPRKRVAAKT